MDTVAARAVTDRQTDRQTDRHTHKATTVTFVHAHRGLTMRTVYCHDAGRLVKLRELVYNMLLS